MFNTTPSIKPKREAIEESYNESKSNASNTAETQRDEIVQQLLQSSRQKLNSGRPSEALESVIEAIRMTQGEDAIMKILDAAKANANPPNINRLQLLQQSIEQQQILNNLEQQRHQSSSSTNLKANKSSSSSSSRHTDPTLEAAMKASRDLIEQSSLLAEIGDGSEFILQEAFEDGSSIICTRCNGLVARERWTAHCAYWCPFSALQTTNNDVDDDDDDN